MAKDHFSTSLATETVSTWKAHRCSALAGLGLCHLHDGQLSEARRLASELPSRPESWTFDPWLWMTLEARLGLASGTHVMTVLEDLRSVETSLVGKMLIPWMRLRMVRFEIATRRGINIPREEIDELESFMADRRIPHRHAELKRLLTRR